MEQGRYSGNYDSDMHFLKMFDPLTSFILCKVLHVRIFLYDSITGADVDYKISGECFVYVREQEPIHCILIVNKQKKKFLREPIVPDLFWEIHNANLIYKKGNTVHSIVFKTEEDYLTLTGIVSNIMRSTPRVSSRLVQRHQMHYMREMQVAQAKKRTPPKVRTRFEQIPPNEKKIADIKPPIQTPTLKVEDVEDLIKILAKIEQTIPMPMLLTPAAFNESKANETSGISNGFECATKPEEIGIEKMTSLLSINDQSADKKPEEEIKIEKSEEPAGPKPLNETEFTEVLTSMLRNDVDFTSQLHEAYLNHLKKK